MRYIHRDPETAALFRLQLREPALGREAFRETDERPLAIVWNRSDIPCAAVVDGVASTLAPQTVVMLTYHQTYGFPDARELVAWEFNREFYCIIDHDAEVSCAGLLFYGVSGLPGVALDAEERQRFGALLAVFEDEFRERDPLQGEMLRMLLKRLIIKLTRLYKRQHLEAALSPDELDLVRQFSLLVEQHYARLHQVRDYAALLYKSPKTLANVFRQHAGERTPQQVIHDRIALEARRRLIYTDEAVAEIGYALGFAEPAHFSRFFSRAQGVSPARFRKTHSEQRGHGSEG